MKSRISLLVVLALVLLLLTATWQTGPKASSDSPRNNVLAEALDIELGQAAKPQYRQQLSSGVIYSLLEASGVLAQRAESALSVNMSVSTFGTQGCQKRLFGRGGLAVRVNQDCSLRRQAEEVIAINPTNSLNLIAGQNDSRIGLNRCGYDWSFDGGRTWGDLIPPFYDFVLDDGHTADACSDPTATFDAAGNAYVAGILFDLFSPASALVVAKSNAGIGGAFYHTPAAVSFQTYRAGPLGVVASDNNANVFHDKEFIVADANAGSLKSGNVYVTWTRFNESTGAGVGVNSPIYFSQSTDGGATWSTGIEISGTNAALCTVFSGSANPNACDQDQGSHPIVGPDGTVYVAFGNGNTPLLGINQVMIVSCPASADCSSGANWTAPVKIGDLIGTHPFGADPTTGCSAGRQCLPPNGYRVPEFTSISISADQAGRLYAVWADFRNGGGTCDWNNGAAGQAALVTPPCDNDVFYSYSTDGGATWSPAHQVTPAGSAQWQPWSAVTPDGTKLWIGYYDRSYGTCEFDGCNDITLAKVATPASASPAVSYTRLTSSSMPNLTPSNNPLEAGFLGDYMWVAVDRLGRPHVIWADTRGLNGTVEEDIYFSKPLVR